MIAVPRFIAHLWWKYLNKSTPSHNSPPPSLLTRLVILSFFYPLPVKLKGNLIQQIWSVTIRALKINQGTKFGTLKKSMFSLFDVIIFLFNGIIKQNNYSLVRLPVSNIWNNRLPRIIDFPWIIAPGYYSRKYSICYPFKKLKGFFISVEFQK